MASDPAKKAKAEADDVKEKAESAEIGRKTRSSLVQGLRWFSDELNKMADSFTAPEKEPQEAPAEEESES